MVAAEVSNNEESSAVDDCSDMVSCSNGHVALADILRPGVHLQGRPGLEALPRDMAATRGRLPVLPDRQPDALLRPAHDPHIPVLHSHMDKGVEAKHTQRYQGRPNGTAAAEVQSQGC